MIRKSAESSEKNIDFFRREYARQRILEKIVRERVLIRPKVKKWQVVICFTTLPFLLAAAIAIPFLLHFPVLWQVLFTVFTVFAVIELYLRFCFILLVKYYQATAKEETRRKCKCIPSCSEYAILSLKKIFPLIAALLKIRKRLYFTCNGDGYKVDFPTKKMERDFENKLR